MKKTLFYLSILLLGFPKPSLEGAKTTHRFTVRVRPITEFSLTGPAILSLNVRNARAGEQPEPVTDTIHYNITSNVKPLKLTAKLSSGLPGGVSLMARATPPSGANSSGVVNLTTSNQSLVTNIPVVYEEMIPLDVTLSTQTTTRIERVTRDIVLTLQDQ